MLHEPAVRWRHSKHQEEEHGRGGRRGGGGESTEVVGHAQVVLEDE